MQYVAYTNTHTAFVSSPLWVPFPAKLAIHTSGGLSWILNKVKVRSGGGKIRPKGRPVQTRAGWFEPGPACWTPGPIAPPAFDFPRLFEVGFAAAAATTTCHMLPHAFLMPEPRSIPTKPHLLMKGFRHKPKQFAEQILSDITSSIGEVVRIAKWRQPLRSLSVRVLFTEIDLKVPSFLSQMSHHSIRDNFAGLMPDQATIQHSTRYFFFFSLVLCAWTHPKYYHTRLARLLRVPLSLISATWWLFYPFIFLVEPRETNVAANVGHFAWTYVMMTKCLDWGLFSGPQHRRRYVKGSNHADGEWEAAEKNSKAQFPHGGLIDHVFLQLTSMRGSQFPWGHFSKLNQNSLAGDLFKYLLCQIYSLSILAGTLHMQKLETTSTDQSSLWLGSIIPRPTLVFLARFISTPFLVTGLCAAFEAVNSALAVLAHLTHPLLYRLGFPEAICEFTNPVYYPPLFENILTFSSLSEYWGKTWHQIYRRSFIVLGAFPLGGVARALGFTTQTQKAVGFVGAFMASGFMHAYHALQYILKYPMSLLIIQ
ncbi:hypothetical protein PTTG_03152 [Puccinia triticina 1-1 BBBD Race 1]|uniref:MBOAT_2 domain-containing protein n=1 Tax=Puccinia triticina (isolate 1-1 / race 1 (BBBD)) TaxID=630390 RepID=A0A180G536_PUCT1|nr:hypothetical protein PTTG_03152 [Puccinia triticina 1-1 BBBD Race 1]